MRAKQFGRAAVAALAITSFAAACGDDDEEPSEDTGTESEDTMMEDTMMEDTTMDSSMDMMTTVPST